MIFNEDKLQQEIIKTWGEFGAHNEVFNAMRNQISEVKMTISLALDLAFIYGKAYQSEIEKGANPTEAIKPYAEFIDSLEERLNQKDNE